jgi:hypothetical protein
MMTIVCTHGPDRFNLIRIVGGGAISSSSGRDDAALDADVNTWLLLLLIEDSGGGGTTVLGVRVRINHLFSWIRSCRNENSVSRYCCGLLYRIVTLSCDLYNSRRGATNLITSDEVDDGDDDDVVLPLGPFAFIGDAPDAANRYEFRSLWRATGPALLTVIPQAERDTEIGRSE